MIEPMKVLNESVKQLPDSLIVSFMPCLISVVNNYPL